MVVASAVADIVRTVLDGQDDEVTKAREAVFRDTNRVNATADGIAIQMPMIVRKISFILMMKEVHIICTQ